MEIVLTVYGIKTILCTYNVERINEVATAPTVYGIETHLLLQCRLQKYLACNSTYRLQY